MKYFLASAPILFAALLVGAQPAPMWSRRGTPLVREGKLELLAFTTTSMLTKA